MDITLPCSCFVRKFNGKKPAKEKRVHIRILFCNAHSVSLKSLITKLCGKKTQLRKRVQLDLLGQ